MPFSELQKLAHSECWWEIFLAFLNVRSSRFSVTVYWIGLPHEPFHHINEKFWNWYQTSCFISRSRVNGSLQTNIYTHVVPILIIYIVTGWYGAFIFQRYLGILWCKANVSFTSILRFSCLSEMWLVRWKTPIQNWLSLYFCPYTITYKTRQERFKFKSTSWISTPGLDDSNGCLDASADIRPRKGHRKGWGTGSNLWEPAKAGSSDLSVSKLGGPSVFCQSVRWAWQNQLPRSTGTLKEKQNHTRWRITVQTTSLSCYSENHVNVLPLGSKCSSAILSSSVVARSTSATTMSPATGCVLK